MPEISASNSVVANSAVIIALVAFIMERALSMLKNRGVDLQKISQQIDALYSWHSKEDSDGVKVWYIRKSLEESIDHLADAIVKDTELLHRIDRRLDPIVRARSDGRSSQ